MDEDEFTKELLVTRERAVSNLISAKAIVKNIQSGESTNFSLVYSRLGKSEACMRWLHDLLYNAIDEEEVDGVYEDNLLTIKKRDDEINGLKSHRDKLKKLLKRLGRHSRDCPYAAGVTREDACRCGLIEALL